MSLIFDFLDKQKDPEDINVKYIRNMKTLNSDPDNTEEETELLTINQ